MAQTPNIDLETLPAGTTNVQSIINSNFQKIDEEFSSHYEIPASASIALDTKDGRTQEMDISANNVTITGIANPIKGANLIVVFHSTVARTITVPNTWEAFGMVWDTGTSAAVTVRSENHVHSLPANEVVTLIICQGEQLTAYGIL